MDHKNKSNQETDETCRNFRRPGRKSCQRPLSPRPLPARRAAGPRIAPVVDDRPRRVP